MDDKDQPQRDVMIKKLVDKHGFKEAEITEIIDKCVKEKGVDACETAFKIFQCYRSNKIVQEKFNKPKASNNPSGTTSAVRPVTPSPSSLTVVPKTSNNNANVGSSSNTPSLPPSPLPADVLKTSYDQQHH